MEKTLQYVANRVEYEGFDYTFRHCSSFESIQDEEFHRLRKLYIEAAENLENYLPEVNDEDEGED